MTPLPLSLSRALLQPPARGWRKSRPEVPANMLQRMAVDEARAWSHSASAGALWESGWRLSRAIAAAEKIAADQNNCCKPPENAGGFPRCQKSNPAQGGSLESTKNEKMKTTTEYTTIISNSFTGYTATIRTTKTPSISTIRKHLRKSKASDCRSITTIYCNGIGLDIANFGNGAELVENGQQA